VDLRRGSAANKDLLGLQLVKDRSQNLEISTRLNKIRIEDLARGAVSGADTNSVSRAVENIKGERNDNLGSRRGAEHVLVDKRAGCVNLADLAVHSDSAFLSALVRLGDCLRLLNDDCAIARVDEGEGVCVQGRLWEADVRFPVVAHPLEAADSLGDYCICVENFVKFPDFEESEVSEMIGLDFPVLLEHRGGMAFFGYFAVFAGDMQGGGVEIRGIRGTVILVFELSGVEKAWEVKARQSFEETKDEIRPETVRERC
jgi:hypothetical protein